MKITSALSCAAVLLLSTSGTAFGDVEDVWTSERELLLNHTEPDVAEAHLQYYLHDIAAKTAGVAGTPQNKTSLVASTKSHDSADTGTTSAVASNKIAKGIAALPMRYRSFARLTRFFQGRLVYHCGGVLISDRVVLTAAHCVWNMANGGLEPGGLRRDAFGAAVGIACDDADNCGYPFVSLRATHYWVHPSWHPLRFVLDIALVRLQERVPNSVAKPAVPDLGNRFRSLTYGYADRLLSVGYGFIDDSGQLPKQLQELNLGYMPADVCERYWGRLYDGVICVYTNDSKAGLFGRGLCWGDSGSPTVVRRVDAPDIVVGVTSFGWIPCTAKEGPDVLARVSAAARYIANVVCYPGMSDFSPEWCRKFGWRTGFQIAPGEANFFDLNPFTPGGASWLNLEGIVEPENEAPDDMTECVEDSGTAYKLHKKKSGPPKKCRKIKRKPVASQKKLCTGSKGPAATISDAGVECCKSCLEFLSEQRQQGLLSV